MKRSEVSSAQSGHVLHVIGQCSTASGWVSHLQEALRATQSQVLFVFPLVLGTTNLFGLFEQENGDECEAVLDFFSVGTSKRLVSV